MSVIKILQQVVETNTGKTTSFNTNPVSLDGALTFGCQMAIALGSVAAKTFLSGVAASLVVQDLTYTANLRGTAGNSITIAYTAGGTAGAEVVTVVGSAISVQIEDGVSTATQIRTAINLVPAATALITCTVSGTGSNAQTIAAVTPLAGGIASAVNVALSKITITAHGFTLGEVGQLTSTGTLPGPFTTSTNYYVIVVDANNIQLAASYVNALAGNPLAITDQGSSGASNTFTPTALSASVQMQESMDVTNPTVWTNTGSSQNITSTGNLSVKEVNPAGNWMRLAYTIGSGAVTVTNTQTVKGPN